MKKIIFCILLAVTTTLSFAQEGERGKRQNREFDPEQVALERTNRLNAVLELDSTQYQAIFIINYADAVTMQDSMKVRRERFEKMRQEGKKPERVRPSEEQMKTMTALQKQREQVRNERMKEILSPEQYEKYLKYCDGQRKNMRRVRGGRAHRK